MGKDGNNPIPDSVGKWECHFDEKGLVYDYMYEVWYKMILMISYEPQSFRSAGKAPGFLLSCYFDSSGSHFSSLSLVSPVTCGQHR